MNKDELKSILEQHRLWVEGNGGKRADLQYADLQYADLQSADLRNADLRNADLRNANLRYDELQYADLRYADLDYSSLPLWCGSKGMIVDRRIAAQIAAHFCALDCDDADYLVARSAILEFAKTSHRAMDLGLLEEREEVAKRLRAFAKGGKYSQRQLALKLNITRYALQGWLYRYPPTAEDCDLIMNLLEEMEQE